MKILMIGDSLTEGVVGVSFVKKLQEMRPADRFVNRGIGGDTLKNIINRLFRELQQHKYDLVVVTGGHNDLLLPHVRHRGVDWENFTNEIIKGGAVLTESEQEFGQNLQMLDQAMATQQIPLILTTLNPLGEQLDSEINLKRTAYNTHFEALTHALVCDTAKAFEEQLQGKESSNYLMESLMLLVGEDAERCEKGESMMMARERGLALTIDGAHLNDKGAQLFAKMLDSAISRVESDVL